MNFDETYILANGVEIPKLGLGTWMISDEMVGQAVNEALAIGYRHFDSAQAYGNERGLGEALRNSRFARHDYFVTTKLEAECKSFEDARHRIDESLAKLGLGHIDLMLIHSPQPWTEFGAKERYFEGNLEAWRALEAAYKDGKIRAIGVSNFQRDDLDNILDNSATRPAVNQILAHIGNTPFDLLRYAEEAGILIEAYSPIAHGAILKNPSLLRVADSLGVTVAQLSIRYCLELGMLPLPKTVTPSHMRSNSNLDFQISPEIMDTLMSIEPLRDYGEAGHFPVFGGGPDER
jgi:diketogulonate reductase-like aldo/keto reductase